jgi:RimJ/RimL family protein N-acetyltransferase
VVVKVLETERLLLRLISLEDAEFFVQLLNEPSFLRFIGDKKVRSLDDARNYILNGPVHSYESLGFGLYLVEMKGSSAPMGICGLLKRDTLDDVDIGFAFLPKFWGNGYALESAEAIMIYGRNVMDLKRILAITSPDNEASIALLEKLGFKFERVTRLSDETPAVKLFSANLTAQ